MKCTNIIHIKRHKEVRNSYDSLSIHRRERKRERQWGRDLCVVTDFGRVLEGWKMVLYSHAILYKHEAIPLAPDLYIFFFQALYATASRIHDGIGTSGNYKSS